MLSMHNLSIDYNPHSPVRGILSSFPFWMKKLNQR